VAEYAAFGANGPLALAVQAGTDKVGAETVIVNVTALDCPVLSFTVTVTGNEPETGRVPLKGKLEPAAVDGPTFPGRPLDVQVKGGVPPVMVHVLA
jgi:hypothetical protein